MNLVRGVICVRQCGKYPAQPTYSLWDVVRGERGREKGVKAHTTVSIFRKMHIGFIFFPGHESCSVCTGREKINGLSEKRIMVF